METANVEEHLASQNKNDTSVNLDVSRTTEVEKGKSDNNSAICFQPNDPKNPYLWPKWRKWTMVALSSLLHMMDNFGTTMIVPAVPQIMEEFRIPDKSYSVLLVTVWELGEGVGSLLVGPLSELRGRLPVYHIGNILFLLCNIGNAMSTNISMLIAFRFLSGLVVTSLALGPSIVADLFEKEERGTAMAIAIAIPMIGPFASPVVGAIIADTLGWRWTAWIIVIVVGGLALLSIVVFRETYASAILRREHRITHQRTESEQSRSRFDNSLTVSSLWKSFMMPIYILVYSPAALIITFFTALTYGISFIILTTLTEVMETNYDFSERTVGLAFLGRAVGNIIGIVLYMLVSDRYIKYQASTRGKHEPHDRLPLMLLGGLALPLGLLMYGWTAQYHVHWIVPLIGTGLVGFSVLLTVLPTENYLVDAYEKRGASAISAGIILRAISGAILPLAGPSLYQSLGLGWGNSLLALISAAFLPFLAMTMYFGDRMLGSHKFE